MFEATYPVFVRNPYNYDPDEASRNSGLLCEDPSLTSQEFAEESDINFMLERFGVTGEISVNASRALQGDFTEVGDYRTMLDQIKAADEAFKALPAQVRRQFQDDPAQFIDFCSDPENREQLKEWGFLQEPPPANPVVNMDDLVKALDAMSAARSAGDPA